MTPRSGRRRWAGVALAGVLAVAVLASCGDDGDAGGVGTTDTGAEAEVIDTVEGVLALLDESGHPCDGFEEQEPVAGAAIFDTTWGTCAIDGPDFESGDVMVLAYPSAEAHEQALAQLTEDVCGDDPDGFPRRFVHGPTWVITTPQEADAAGLAGLLGAEGGGDPC